MKLLLKKFIKHRDIEQNVNFVDQLRAEVDNTNDIKRALTILDPFG